MLPSYSNLSVRFSKVILLIFALYIDVELKIVGANHAEKIKQKYSQNSYYNLVSDYKL